jgi:hypothetical protein
MSHFVFFREQQRKAMVHILVDNELGDKDQ